MDARRRVSAVAIIRRDVVVVVVEAATMMMAVRVFVVCVVEVFVVIN
jgi:hypothetical protein